MQTERVTYLTTAEQKAALEALFRILMPVRWLYMVNLALGILLIGIKAKRSLYRDGVLS